MAVAATALHEPLRGYDPRTAHLVSAIEEFGATLDADDLPGCDIVHCDFHPGSSLRGSTGLSAVVDTDFAIVGDAAADLVMLALGSLTMRCDRAFG